MFFQASLKRSSVRQEASVTNLIDLVRSNGAGIQKLFDSSQVGCAGCNEGDTGSGVSNFGGGSKLNHRVFCTLAAGGLQNTGMLLWIINLVMHDICAVPESPVVRSCYCIQCSDTLIGVITVKNPCRV